MSQKHLTCIFITAFPNEGRFNSASSGGGWAGRESQLCHYWPCNLGTLLNLPLPQFPHLTY